MRIEWTPARPPSGQEVVENCPGELDARKTNGEWRRSGAVVGLSLRCGFCDQTDVRRTCAATAADDLGTGDEPFRGKGSIGFRVILAGPAAALGVPTLA